MEAVDINHLALRLGEVLRRVREGQPCVITDQGEPVLEMTALQEGVRKDAIKLVLAGKASWSGEKPEGHRGLPRIEVRGEPVSETIIRARR